MPEYSREIHEELKRFDADAPIERAATPPRSWYLRPDFLELEKAAVFRRSWQPVARLAQLAKPGDYVAGELLGLPYVVLRDPGGKLAAFYNTCRHHAARILSGDSAACGPVRELTCPYHGWTYGLDGSLKAAPRMEGSQDFDRARFGLAPISVEAWGPFAWIHFDPNPEPLKRQLAGLEERLQATGIERLQFHSRRAYELECNWKVYVDNYLDGGYHVPVLHRGLAAQLNLGSYRTETFDRFSIQSCRGKNERIGDGALYAWIYPGFMINRYGPAMDTNWVIPLSPTRTLTVFDFYFEDPGAAEFIAKSLESSEKVQAEDVAISESVQKGLASGAYETGRYAPALEQGELHFHRLLARELRR